MGDGVRVHALQEALWQVLGMVPLHHENCECERCSELIRISALASEGGDAEGPLTEAQVVAELADLARRWPAGQLGLYYRGYRGLLLVRLKDDGHFPIVWEKDQGGTTAVSGIEEESIVVKVPSDLIPMWAAWRKVIKFEKGRPRGDSSNGETEEEHEES